MKGIGGSKMRGRVTLGWFAAVLMVAAVLLPAPAHAEGTVSVTVTGQGAVTGDGITCNQSGGPDCTEFYADTQEQICDPDRKPPCYFVDVPPEVTLTAGSDSNGFIFDHWTGCDSVVSRNCNLTVNNNTALTAVFRDVQAPSVFGLSPSSGAHRGTITLSASANDNASVNRVEFRVRGILVGTDTSAPYSTGFDTASVADGSAVLRATAFDASGNAAALETTVTLDNTAPVLNVDSGPNGQTDGPGSTQTWTFTASDATTTAATACSVTPLGQSPTFAACSGPGSHSVTGLPGGNYRFLVRATDTAGNVVTVERAFAIDATAPDTSITSGPADGAVLTSGSAAFGLSSDDPSASFRCRLYVAGTTAPPFGACTSASSHTVSGLGEGGYVFEATAADTVGNTDATPARRTFTVDFPAPVPPPVPPPADPGPLPDHVAPQTTLDKKPKAKVHTSHVKVKVVFAFSASEAGSTFECKLDGAGYKPCTSPAKYRVKRGKHVFRIRAVDAAGNVDTTPALYRFKVIRKG